MKQRVTVSLPGELLELLDHAPGGSRSEKLAGLLEEALAAREHRRWVSELNAFYKAGPERSDRKEDVEWQALGAEAFERQD